MLPTAGCPEVPIAITFYLLLLAYNIRNKMKSGLLQPSLPDVVRTACLDGLGFFVDNVPLSSCTFPILELTYTLWRKQLFQKLKKDLDSHPHHSIVKHFHDISERELLPKFVIRVKTEMNTYCRGLKNVQENLKENLQQTQKMPNKDEQKLFALLLEIGENVWMQQLYIELIKDLIQLPYLNVISSSTAIIPKPQFQTNYIFERPKQTTISKLTSKVKSTALSKGLTSLTEIMCSPFVVKVTTLVGTFDPLIMGATYGVSSFLKYWDKKKKDQCFEEEFKGALEFSKNKAKTLEDIYGNCCQLVDEIVSLGERDSRTEDDKKKELRLAFLKVFEEEWLEISVKKDENGWDLVSFKEREEIFEVL